MALTFTFTDATYDDDNVITTGTVLWSDGSTGTFTRTVKNDTFLSIDGYTVTYVKNGVTYTITQAGVTRDALGRVATWYNLAVT